MRYVLSYLFCVNFWKKMIIYETYNFLIYKKIYKMWSIRDIVFDKISMVKTNIENNWTENVLTWIQTLQFIHWTLIAWVFDEERQILENTIKELQHLKATI